MAAAVFYCQQAKDLLDALTNAMREVITLHEDQFHAVLQGDDDSGRFDDLIHLANERQREAKYAYLQHLETHNCSRIMPDGLKL
jgi:tRNA splicing endonuclease